LRARGDRRALEQLLHEIDAPARTVELIAEQLVSGTGGKTEAAVHARAQDRMRLAPGGGVFDEVRERGAHGFPDPIGTQQRGAVTARVPAKDSKLIRAAAVRTAGLRGRQRSGPILACIAGRRGRPPLARVAGGVASRVIPLRRTLKSGSAYGSALATVVAAEASVFGAVASSASLCGASAAGAGGSATEGSPSLPVAPRADRPEKKSPKVHTPSVIRAAAAP